MRATQYRKDELHICNVGTGRPTSVLELVSSFEETCEMNIPNRFSNRRTDDVTSLHSNTNNIRSNLGWKHQRTLNDMCKSSLNQFENASVV